eukprot:c9203_g1_i2.p1 GENE.c9203_g1_i2~~c9203_g1_i2.p1  ORF type:complete len:452 (-),score=61.29 c9203_g1_i2:618-1886(-)
MDMISQGNLSDAQLNDVSHKIGITGWSALCMFSDSQFQLTTDLVIDGMHLLLEGLVSKLLHLTFHTEFNDYPWNIHNNLENYQEFQHRMRLLKFPSELRPLVPNLAETHNRYTAEETFTFLKMCALWTLRDLLSPDAYKSWRLLTPLVCGLLHYDVKKEWVRSLSAQYGLSFQIKEYLDHHSKTYGKCHMPANFHYLLHTQTDCILWSCLRSHWLFKFERLNHTLIQFASASNKQHVAKSVARMISDLSSITRSISPKTPLLCVYLSSRTKNQTVNANEQEILQSFALECAGLGNALRYHVKVERYSKLHREFAIITVGECAFFEGENLQPSIATIQSFISVTVYDRVDGVQVSRLFVVDVSCWMLVGDIDSHNGLYKLCRPAANACLPSFVHVDCLVRKVVLFPYTTHCCSLHGMLPWSEW